MQVISSLMSLQSQKVNDDKIKEVFQESRDRITAMALVHQVLYESKSMANIDLEQYVYGMTNSLLAAYGSRTQNVDLKVESKMVTLDIDQVIPFGLVINELVSNSLKHAFTKKGGLISVFARSTGEDEIELIISDNGVGIPDEIDIRKTNTLGLQLVVGLVENQLSGSLELNREKGTEFKIKFKKKIHKERI